MFFDVDDVMMRKCLGVFYAHHRSGQRSCKEQGFAKHLPPSRRVGAYATGRGMLNHKTDPKNHPFQCLPVALATTAQCADAAPHFINIFASSLNVAPEVITSSTITIRDSATVTNGLS